MHETPERGRRAGRAAEQPSRGIAGLDLRRTCEYGARLASHEPGEGGPEDYRNEGVGWILRRLVGPIPFRGEKPKIWRDPKLQGNDVFAEELLARLAKAALLLAVLTRVISSPIGVRGNCTSSGRLLNKRAAPSLEARPGSLRW
jgi:hypothetical protein